MRSRLADEGPGVASCGITQVVGYVAGPQARQAQDGLSCCSAEKSAMGNVCLLITVGGVLCDDRERKQEGCQGGGALDLKSLLIITACGDAKPPPPKLDCQ